MVHVPSVDLSTEEQAKLRFLAARHFRFAQLRCQALKTPLPDEPQSIHRDLLDQLGSSVSDLLLWLVAQAERCPVPGGWCLMSNAGRELYIDEFSCLPPRTVHPMLGHFLRLATIIVTSNQTSTSRHGALTQISRLRRDLGFESQQLRGEYENPKACGLQEWYHKQRGWFTSNDPLQAHKYLLKVLDDLERKLCEDLPLEKASQISVEGTEALQLHGFGCSVFDISSRRTKDCGTWKLELASSPDSTMGADSVGGTELECQYEQNWSSLVSVSNNSIHTTPTVPSSAESEVFRPSPSDEVFQELRDLRPPSSLVQAPAKWVTSAFSSPEDKGDMLVESKPLRCTGQRAEFQGAVMCQREHGSDSVT
eukprot:symbB.v1.2.019778.t1/scaffold1634.1/size108475/6